VAPGRGSSPFLVVLRRPGSLRPDWRDNWRDGPDDGW
jgi:hypothetical protein